MLLRVFLQHLKLAMHKSNKLIYCSCITMLAFKKICLLHYHRICLADCCPKIVEIVLLPPGQ